MPVRAISDLSAGEEQTLVLVPPPIDSSKRRSATLAIQVRDDADDPVPFATLRLDGTTEAALTDSMGISTVHRLYPGSYLLQVRRIGYEPRDTIIVVAAGPVATTDTIQVERVAARLAVVNVQGRNGGAFVTPMIATAVTLTLGTDGSLRHVALSGSSTSDTVDSLVLAAARRAGSAHTFPVLHDVRDHPDTVPAHLAISMAEPAAGEQAVALGRLDAPAWPSVGAAHLAKMPSLPADILSDFAMGGDTASLEFVVNERGKALPATVRLDYSSAGPLPSDKGKRADRERFVRRVAGLLHDFRFDAGRVAACRVPEFIRQPFGYTLRAVSRP